MEPKDQQIKQMDKPKKHFGFQASPELAEIIAAEAKRTRRPISSFIRAVLEMVLMPHPDDEPEEVRP